MHDLVAQPGPCRNALVCLALCAIFAAAGCSEAAAEPRDGRVRASKDLVRRVAKLRGTVPEGFTVIAEPPFAVIGNESPATVRARAAGTVRFATRLLKKDFFAKDPEEIIDIWLFGDAPSYYHFSKALFGEEPGTPYGYYTEFHRALVMNIGTGGGTLVHEMVHPFVSANFPGCPPWINEGLGSLYEACTERDGKIWGLPNWRLPGLKEAIADGSLPSFKELTAQDTDAFYNEDPGTNYSQSRYLLYYLQEKGLLRRFYHQAVANHATDPTGYQTLKRVLGVDDMDAFKNRWECWVMGLEWS